MISRFNFTFDIFLKQYYKSFFFAEMRARLEHKNWRTAVNLACTIYSCHAQPSFHVHSPCR